MPSTAVAAHEGLLSQSVLRPSPTTDTDDLLRDLQMTLASLTNLEIRHELEVDDLEELSSWKNPNRGLYAERERTYQQARTAHLQQLTALRRQIMGHN